MLVGLRIMPTDSSRQVGLNTQLLSRYRVPHQQKHWHRN